MATFTLDTSGAVGPMPSGYEDPENRRGFWSFPRARYVWSDLSPFVMGYVEALFAEPIHGDKRTRWGRNYGFSDLDPSALALILRDCERWQHLYPNSPDGARFWELRNLQLIERPDFPPLQPYLSDEGRVCLRGVAV